MEKPVCHKCNKPLLNGKNAAWKERGDVGDWTNLLLLCDEHRPARRAGFYQTHQQLRCECPCRCGGVAVTVAMGKLSCASCYTHHTVDVSETYHARA